MASSANTFGTFLQTLDHLERQQGSLAGQSQASAPGSDAKDVVGLVREISKTGDRAAVDDLVDVSGVTKEKLFITALAGKQQGLIDLSEDQGKLIANLTNLGKLFKS